MFRRVISFAALATAMTFFPGCNGNGEYRGLFNGRFFNHAGSDSACIDDCGCGDCCGHDCGFGDAGFLHDAPIQDAVISDGVIITP